MHGGKRDGAGRKPYPSFFPEGIVIDVRDSVAYVSVWRRDTGRFWLEEATNWDVLADDAAEEVEALGGAVTMSGIYPCSAGLAAQARFE